MDGNVILSEVEGFPHDQHICASTSLSVTCYHLLTNHYPKFILSLKRGKAAHPFIPQRIASLMKWAESDEYREILTRTSQPGKQQVLRFRSIEMSSLGEGQNKEAPYVKIHYNNDVAFTLEKPSEKTSNLRWDNLHLVLDFQEGCPVFLEIWNHKYFGYFDPPLGLGMSYPTQRKTEHVIQLNRNIEERATTTKQPIATVAVGIQNVDSQ